MAALELLVRHVLERLGEGRAELRRVGIVAVVPFAEDAGAIAVGLEALGDGRFLQRQFAADLRRGADADRMAPGQQHRARRRADAPAHELRQFDALREEPVDVRRGHAAAVDAQVAPADIVGHDVNDVGFRRIVVSLRGRDRKTNRDQRDKT